MVENDEDFLAAVEADNANEPVVEQEPEVVPEPEAEPVVEEPQEPANPSQAPVVEAKPDPGFVPITVVLDEREKRQRLEQELAQFRAQQQQQPETIPDRYDDPEGFEAYQEQKVQRALYDQNLRWSERIAVSEHGAETVKEAREWAYARCNEDPYFNAKVAASPDPIGFAVSEWKREQIASSVTSEDLNEFRAWKKAQAELQANTQVAQQPRSAPPRSLAGAPSAGGVMTEPEPTDQDIFEDTFKRA